jgi:protein-S-isoprenylcysteine O-methyltransferase Ste14
MTNSSNRFGLDKGRLVVVPVAAGVLAMDVVVVLRHADRSPLGLAGSVLACAFYALIIWNYLRRGPAVATSGSIAAGLAAVAATLAPTLLPLLHGAPPGQARQATADMLLFLGSAWSVWSLRYLGKNLSVLAQARAVSDRGPYRIVRHPLYTGEIVSTLGIVLVTGKLAAFALWLALVALQVCRAMAEEKVLLAALPGYREYRARTPALLPWPAALTRRARAEAPVPASPGPLV